MMTDVIAYTAYISTLENKIKMKLHVFEQINNNKISELRNKISELRNEISTLKIGLIVCLIIYICMIIYYYMSKLNATRYRTTQHMLPTPQFAQQTPYYIQEPYTNNYLTR
jgi:uncharacterized membrane protein